MQDMLVVYTMGKVASTTISEAIEKAGRPCYDVHTLIESGLLNDLQNFAATNSLPPKHFGQSLAIVRDFANPEQKVKLITCIRDPFARNLSATFQNLPEGVEISLAAISQRLEATNPDKPGAWLRKDFLTSTGIDLLKQPFDKDKKYARYSLGRFEILVLRVDLDDQTKAKQISDFIGVKVELERKNDASTKWYQAIYANYLTNGRISREWVEACVNSNYIKHYFTHDEIQRMQIKARRFYS